MKSLKILYNKVISCILNVTVRSVKQLISNPCPQTKTFLNIIHGAYIIDKLKSLNIVLISMGDVFVILFHSNAGFSLYESEFICK